MATQDELIVRIGADFEELKKGLKKAGDETEKFGKETQKTSKVVDTSFASVKAAALGVAGAIGAATIAIGAMSKEVLENAKEQKLWAKRLAVSEFEFGKLVAVSRRFGAETDDVGDAMKDLNERIADAARGNKTYEEALNMVGLASKDLIKLPVEEQFIKVADAIGKMTNAGDQNFATAELMADAGFRLLEVFRLGEKGIRDMGVEVLKTNEAMTKFELAKIDEANKATKELELAFGAVKNTVTQEAIPAIKYMTRLLKDAAEFWGEIFTLDNTELREELVKVNDELKLADERLAAYQKKIGRGETNMFLVKLQQRALDLANRRAELQRELNELEVIMGEKQRTTIEGKQRELELEEKIAAQKGKGGLKVEGDDINAMFGEALGMETDEELQKRAEAIAEAYTSAAELYQNLQLEKASIRAQADAEEIAARQALNDELMGIDRDAMERNRQIWESGWRGKLSTMGDVMGSMSSLMMSENKKMFEIGKAASIGETIINTIEGAQKAFTAYADIPKVGPIIGAAAAAAVAVSGMARVNQSLWSHFRMRQILLGG